MKQELELSSALTIRAKYEKTMNFNHLMENKVLQRPCRKDGGECYWVFRCQYFLCLLGINMTSYEDRESEFNDYCSKRGITECFQVSDYKQNLDYCAENFIQRLGCNSPFLLRIPSPCARSTAGHIGYNVIKATAVLLQIFGFKPFKFYPCSLSP